MGLTLLDRKNPSVLYHHVYPNIFYLSNTRGEGGFFHSKGTWGCAAHEGILFWASSLAKGYFLAILVEFSLGKGMLFGNFGQRTVKVR